jgi:hypothetical protein
MIAMVIHVILEIDEMIVNEGGEVGATQKIEV